MSHDIGRRDFLKAVPLAGTFAAAASTTAQPRKSVEPRIGTTSYAPIADYPIQPKRYWEVAITDTFWKSKITTNAAVTIPSEVRKLSEGDRQFGGNVLEAAILSLKTYPNAALQAAVDARVAQMIAAPPAGNRWFEVAVTYFVTTGRRELLDRAVAAAAAIYDDFRTNNPPFSGGERDALNCLQLYRATRDKKHLDLAKHYLDIRGLENSVGRSRHNQSYKPVLEQSEAVGHAVNGVTLMTSLADAGIFTGLKDYFSAAHRMWTDAVERKMYITGGVGTTGNEGFGEPYSLPNISAYAETCAVLMFITLNHKLFLATGDSQYIDVMERGMYNNAIDGVAISGDRFFYVNRLASAGDGRDHRWERASLECCPPNLVRFLASMPALIYAQAPDGSIYVNLYVSSNVSFTVGGTLLALSATSEMPWGGRSSFAVAAKADVNASIKFRIPGWARDQPAPGGLYNYSDKAPRQALIAINGQPVSAAVDRAGYVSMTRLWKNGDVIDIDLPMEARRVVADRRVKDNARRVAIERGPLVYCAEWPDVSGGRALDLLLQPATPLGTSVDAGFSRGAVVITTVAQSVTNPSAAASPVKLIPYHLWANRGAGEMSVWLAAAEYEVGDTGPAGGFIFYVNPNYARDGWRYLEAAPFDQSAGATWGCFRRDIPGARGTAVGTGKQNTADMVTACAEPGTAAHLCASLSLNGVRGWFLPSRDELALLYRNLRAGGAGDFEDRGIADNVTYWASSQQTADMAVHIDFADLGRLHGDDKDFPRRVRAIRTV
jgi:uncharacterized protein